MRTPASCAAVAVAVDLATNKPNHTSLQLPLNEHMPPTDIHFQTQRRALRFASFAGLCPGQLDSSQIQY